MNGADSEQLTDSTVIRLAQTSVASLQLFCQACLV
jgi:hypothetical protein